ncbi:MAG: Ppx/GppA family phosphatase [bacterium]
MRLAAIDLGTNSTRLLVVEKSGSVLRPIHQDLATTRLGRGSGHRSHLLPEAMEQTAKVAAEFFRRAQNLGAERIRMFGTSALREADNQDRFLALLESRLGCKPEVLSGEEEARLTYSGAVGALKLEDSTVIIDVGGGSTEVIQGRGKQVLSLTSLRLGAVRLTERFLLSDPPTAAEWQAMLDFVSAQLKAELLPLKDQAAQGVAVGGTATTLAALELKLERYSYAQVQGYFLPCSRLHSLTERMRLLPLAKRRQLPGLQPERADIILAGAAILSLALEILALPGLTVSAADLLLGSLYDLLAVYPLSQQRSRQ